jgi:hypothetical protein
VQIGPLIRYSFTDPDETLQLRLGENSSRLDLYKRRRKGKIFRVEAESKIRGTSLTYEDLAFKFLYWPNACAG